MSSVIFQPLLHDPLGWKQSNTTYSDTYKWKNYRSSSKDKRISAYGQQYQRQLQKQQKLQQINCLPTATNEEQTSQQVFLMKKNEENRGTTASSTRSSMSKTPPVLASDQPPAFIVEYKQRSASTNREATCGSRTSQRSLPVPTVVEESPRPATSVDARRSPKEEKEKEKVITDANNDNSRHWLTYPHPKTPQYLIDIKQRLGQLKVPSPLLRTSSTVNGSVEPSEVSVAPRESQQTADQRNFLDFNLPETPNELRAARHRLEKHRYNSSLDNYPTRPQTCPERTNENIKPPTPPTIPQSDNQQLPPIQTTSIKDDVWTNEEEETKPNENETSSILVQMVDTDGLPNDYVEALEIASMAQEEFYKNLKSNTDKKPENTVYRLPSMSTENQNESFIAYRNQQQSTNNNNNNNSTRQNNFGTWVRNATDKERESAMKILQDVLYQPIMGYDIPKQQSLSKKPPSLRTNSAPRKLGRTRNPHQRIPCEICEKTLIKRHVWNLNRSETLTCPHQAQGIKPPIIQVRA